MSSRRVVTVANVGGWQPPPGAHYTEDGAVLNWPTSGLSDQAKMAEALAIADAKRAGMPYATPSGVNLGTLMATDDEVAPKPREKWPKTCKIRKASRGTGKKTKKTSLQRLREKILSLQAELKARTPTKSGVPSRSSTPRTARPPRRPRKSTATPSTKPATGSKPKSSATSATSRTMPAAP